MSQDGSEFGIYGSIPCALFRTTTVTGKSNQPKWQHSMRQQPLPWLLVQPRMGTMASSDLEEHWSQHTYHRNFLLQKAEVENVAVPGMWYFLRTVAPTHCSAEPGFSRSRFSPDVFCRLRRKASPGPVRRPVPG